jgi:hypothetical protein
MTRSGAAFEDGAPEHVRSLLVGFRLLEAAGACELIARNPRPGAAQTSRWWSTLATNARAYRGAVFATAADGYAAIESWVDVGGVDDPGLAETNARLSLEFEYWLNVVAGGDAYIAWLSAYLSAAELDGHATVRALERCAAIESEFLDAPGVAVALSLYEQLQLAADALPRFLPLPQHPLRDMRRFALLPDSSQRKEPDAFNLHSNRQPRDSGTHRPRRRRLLGVPRRASDP